MQLPVQGHPLHTRSLTLVVTTREDGRWNARGDVIDLRKVGFVPLLADIQPAGIIHQMSIELVIDPATSRIDSVEVDQPFVAIEPSPVWGGECCRDPAPRLQALAGERLDGSFARQLSGVFGGPRGCSHLLTLFQLMNTGLQRAMALESAAGEGREVGDWLFRRSVFVEGFECPDEVPDNAIDMAVQLADFHSRPGPAPPMSLERLAGQWEVRFFGRVSGPKLALSKLLLAERERSAETLGSSDWVDLRDRVSALEGSSAAGGFAKRLFETFDGAEDTLLLDATLQLAPGYVQVMAAVMDRWLAKRRDDAEKPGPPAGAIGGMADSCYMWRSEGQMIQIRNVGILRDAPGS